MLVRKNSEYKKISIVKQFTVIIIALLGIVIYFGNIMIINTSKITDIICLVSFPFMSISGIACVICFLVPLHSGITGLYIYGYAILMILIKAKKIQVRIFIPLLIVVIYEIIMMLFAKTLQMNYIIVYALTVFLLLYIMNSEEIDPKFACVSYICGTLVLLICIFSTAIQNFSLLAVLSGTIRIGQYEGLEDIGQVAIVTENANAMAYYALVAIIIAFCMIKNAKLFEKILLATSIVFLTLIALFTVSRTFIFVLVFLLLLSYLSSNNFQRKLKTTLVIFLLLMIIVPYLLEKTQILDAFIARFEDDSLSTGTGRTNIFAEYIEFLFDHPLRFVFGTGAVFYQKVCNLGHSMHNGTQQILVSYGVLGFLPAIGVLISPILVFFKKNKFQLDRILPVLAVFLFTQSIQFLNPNNLMLPYAIAILCMKIPDMEVAQ